MLTQTPEIFCRAHQDQGDAQHSLTLLAVIDLISNLIL